MFGMLRVEDGQPGALACPQYLAGIMTLGPISPLKPQHSPHCTWNVCSTVQRIGHSVLSIVWSSMSVAAETMILVFTEVVEHQNLKHRNFAASHLGMVVDRTTS